MTELVVLMEQMTCRYVRGEYKKKQKAEKRNLLNWTRSMVRMLMVYSRHLVEYLENQIQSTTSQRSSVFVQEWLRYWSSSLFRYGTMQRNVDSNVVELCTRQDNNSRMIEKVMMMMMKEFHWQQTTKQHETWIHWKKIFPLFAYLPRSSMDWIIMTYWDWDFWIKKNVQIKW